MSSSLFYYEPTYDWDRFFDENFFGDGGNRRRRIGNGGGNENAVARAFRPSMDLHENKENNTVTASFELPGVKKEDVNIDVHNGRLTVSAETQISTDHDQSGYAVQERRYGKFSRTLQLPQGVKDDVIKAKMDNGVLTVTFPKTTPDMEHKRVTVS